MLVMRAKAIGRCWSTNGRVFFIEMRDLKFLPQAIVRAYRGLIH